MTYAVNKNTTVFSRLSLQVAALATCAAFSFPVLAQNAAPAAGDAPTSAPSAQVSKADRSAKRQEWHAKHAQRQAERMAKFKQSLALTPAQEGAWNDFSASMQKRNDFARLGHGDMEKLTTPERIDRMRAMRAQRSAAMDQREDATKAFYAQLQPAQQKTFDQASARMMRMGHMGKHGGRDGHKGHGGKKGHEGHQGRMGHHGSMGAQTPANPDTPMAAPAPAN